jgi:hypothetical protein
VLGTARQQNLGDVGELRRVQRQKLWRRFHQVVQTEIELKIGQKR